MWVVILTLIILAIIIMVPVILVWYLNIGDIATAIKGAIAGRFSRGKEKGANAK